MSHVMFGGLTHEPAVRLATHAGRAHPAGPGARLPLRLRLGQRRGGRSRCALQYQRAVGPPGQAPAGHLARRLPRRHVPPDERLRPRRAACTACGPGCCPAQVFAPIAAGRLRRTSYVATALAEALERHADELAAVIVEPVVQGAGGMRFHHPAYLRVLRERDRRARGPADLRRDRHRLRAHRARCSPPTTPGSRPDVMCVGKALTGGYLTLAGDAVHARRSPRASRAGAVPVLAHGPTFMGNPLACAVANASIELLRAGDWAGRRAADRGGPAAPVWRRCAGAAGRRSTSGCSARSAWCSSTTTVDMPAATAAAVGARGVAAPVPGPDLHDAAVRRD